VDVARARCRGRVVTAYFCCSSSVTRARIARKWISPMPARGAEMREESLRCFDELDVLLARCELHLVTLWPDPRWRRRRGSIRQRELGPPRQHGPPIRQCEPGPPRLAPIARVQLHFAAIDENPFGAVDAHRSAEVHAAPLADDYVLVLVRGFCVFRPIERSIASSELAGWVHRTDELTPGWSRAMIERAATLRRATRLKPVKDEVRKRTALRTAPIAEPPINARDTRSRSRHGRSWITSIEARPRADARCTPGDSVRLPRAGALRRRRCSRSSSRAGSCAATGKTTPRSARW
jgi:hypothetical protein